jgi:hypothetical protein
MKKLSIIGAGSAGLLSAVQAHYYFVNRSDWDIELIHDPNLPPEKVGQGTVPGIMDIMSIVFDIDWTNNPFDATQKHGIMYKNWGKKKNKFFHPFGMGYSAAHYDVNKLREFILKSNKFKVIEKNIKNYDEIDSDYIIDCSGKPKTFDNYKTLLNPVNSVLLGRSEGKEDFQWTDCVATPDGWCFRIPNIDSVSYGYLFNKEITDVDQAKINFKDIFDIDSIDTLFFSNYISKDFMIDNRIFLNGNKLMFLEPLEANSNPAYVFSTARYLKYMTGKMSKRQVCEQISDYILKIQNYLLWLYQSGSKYDTPFWNHASKLKFEDNLFDSLVSLCTNRSREMLWSMMESGDVPQHYGQWDLSSIRNWIENTK